MPPGLNQRVIAAIAVFLGLAGIIGYFIYDRMEQNDALQADIDRVNAEIADLDKVIATRKEKQDLRDAQELVFKQLVEILPQYSEKQDESVLEAVTQCGASSKLTFGGVIIGGGAKPPAGGAPAPQGPNPGGKPAGPSGQDFAQTDLTIRFTGTYFNFLKFLNLVENRESFLRVDQVTLTPIGPTPGQPVAEGPADQKLLSIQVKVSTFAFVPR